MPNPKTTLRVAMAAIAAPGIIAGMAAPAAHAADLAPSAKSMEGHVSDAQHTSLAGAEQQATSTVTKHATTQAAANPVHSDLLSSNPLETSNTLNGQSMSV